MYSATSWCSGPANVHHPFRGDQCLDDEILLVTTIACGSASVVQLTTWFSTVQIT